MVTHLVSQQVKVSRENLKYVRNYSFEFVKLK